jgi:hypothetical protein
VTRARRDHLWLGGTIGLLVAIALVRLLVLGWDVLAPDDARYLFVGLSVLDGHGAVTPAGLPYLLRSPVYGVSLALGARALGGDVITGAHVVAATLGIAGLLGATLLAWRLGGSVAAVATGLALVATPLPWALLPTLRVDQALAALVVGVVLLASTGRPGLGRAAVAGAVMGVGVLVKEAVLPVLMLPIAWASVGSRRRWLGEAAAFVLVVVVVAGWWWVVVWADAGVLFPLNGIDVIEARQVEVGTRLGRLDIAVAMAGMVAWLIVGVSAVRRPRIRPLVAAAVGLLPAAAYALARGLAARNFLPLALLTGVAIGIAASLAVEWIRARPAVRSGRARWAFVAVGALAVTTTATAAQVTATRPSSSHLAARTTAGIVQHTRPGDAVVMPFRDRESIVLGLYGRNPVRSLGTVRVQSGDQPADYVWMGLRDHQLFGITRAAWKAALGQPDVALLVIVLPHPLSPAALVPSLQGPGPAGDPGTQALDVIADGGSANLFSVAPGRAVAGAELLVLHLDASAAAAWLALGGGDALDRLAAAQPVLVPDDSVGDLRSAVSGAACLSPAGTGYTEGWLRLLPLGTGCAALAP